MFHVNSHPIQRGRGLGGVFANIFKRIIPFGKTLAKSAINVGKDFAKSDVGKEIINDTLSSSVAAAKHALIDNNKEEAKQEIMNSLKRTGKKSKKIIKKVAKEKLKNLFPELENTTKKKKFRKKKGKKKKKIGSLLDNYK